MNKNYTLSFLLLDSMCLSLPICISLYFTNQNIVILSVFRCYFNFMASFPPKKKKKKPGNTIHVEFCVPSQCCALVGGDQGMKLYSTKIVRFTIGG